jgi:hypothetical protein
MRTIHVVWDEVKIGMPNYSNFTVGPFSESVVVPDGATDADVEAARSRVYAALDRFAKASYAEKLAAYKRMASDAR